MAQKGHFDGIGPAMKKLGTGLKIKTKPYFLENISIVIYNIYILEYILCTMVRYERLFDANL